MKTIKKFIEILIVLFVFVPLYYLGINANDSKEKLCFGILFIEMIPLIAWVLYRFGIWFDSNIKK